MGNPVKASDTPYEVSVEAGKSYAWCACGRSTKQPWCDGSHKDTEWMPLVWKAEQSETVYLCGCKRTEGQPLCDGTHATL